MIWREVQNLLPSEHKFKGAIGEAIICLSVASFRLMYSETTLCLEKEGEGEKELVRAGGVGGWREKEGNREEGRGEKEKGRGGKGRREGKGKGGN